MTRRTITLDQNTIKALEEWSAYIGQRIDKKVSLAAAVRWLASGRLKVKEGI